MVIIVIMSALNIYPYYSISVLMGRMSTTFELNVELNQLNTTLAQLDHAYENYLETKHSKNLDDYYRYSNDLWNQAGAIRIENTGTENMLLMKDIRNMIANYLEEMDAAVSARRSRMVDSYLSHYEESTRIHRYIEEYIQKLNNTLFYQNTDQYNSIRTGIQLVQTLNFGVIVAIIVLTVVLIFWFTYRITKPIYELSREAELHALQSQINPHFLFNTLNAGAQLAMMEGADRACTFIENAAELFRYNMRNMDKPVTIGDEIRNVENYMHLLKERFADKIEFMLEKEDRILNVRIPCMILQPIVENAYIHGVGDMEETGMIWLNAGVSDGMATISIRDNGKGISQEKIEEILSGDTLSERLENPGSKYGHKGHTNGIGLGNIISRLKIFYERENIIKIYSEPGKGTEVVLFIPIKA